MSGNPFHKGQRVRYTEAGRKQFAFRAGRPGPFRVGTVSAEPMQDETVAVVWDGSTGGSVHNYALKFIELADEPDKP